MEETSSSSQISEPPGTRENSTFPNNEIGDLTSGSRIFAYIQSQPGVHIPRTRKSFAAPKNIHTDYFRKKWFPKTTATEWNDWRWQLQNRICSPQQLETMFQLTSDERNAFAGDGRSLPVAITPYYASLVREKDCGHPIRKCVIPSSAEQVYSLWESTDPLSEENHSPVPGIVHRYPDRVLFLATNFCSTYCRYCTRSRMVGDHACHSRPAGRQAWQGAISYIESHPGVRDVLISGGDPLTLPDEDLEWLLGSIRKIPHVEIIRLGTKVPAVLPQRITPSLLKVLRSHHPLLMSLHFAHPDELTPETRMACELLADAGIPLGSQTVLLAGINDEPEVLKQLFHGLLRARVRPYYLYQCDPIMGSSHFRTPVEKGIKIISQLRGHTTGYAVPQYVIDAPGGGGKIPVGPEYVIGYEGSNLLLRNYEGKVFQYPDHQ